MKFAITFAVFAFGACLFGQAAIDAPDSSRDGRRIVCQQTNDFIIRRCGVVVEVEPTFRLVEISQGNGFVRDYGLSREDCAGVRNMLESMESKTFVCERE